MKKRKNAIIITTAIIILIIVLIRLITYIVKNRIYFEIDREKIATYYSENEYSTPHFFVWSKEKAMENLEGSTNEDKKKVYQILDQIDANKYRVLVIVGGELESFRMINSQDNDGVVKGSYKKSGSKNQVEYYLITRKGYINVELQFPN
ncbi:MAG: hypothetical protein PUC65_01600 [Clostridiales bacterium]|nr:hypothetical protein [Clostridiales bacterium]